MTRTRVVCVMEEAVQLEDGYLECLADAPMCVDYWMELIAEHAIQSRLETAQSCFVLRSNDPTKVAWPSRCVNPCELSPLTAAPTGVCAESPCNGAQTGHFGNQGRIPPPSRPKQAAHLSGEAQRRFPSRFPPAPRPSTACYKERDSHRRGREDCGTNSPEKRYGPKKTREGRICNTKSLCTCPNERKSKPRLPRMSRCRVSGRLA